MDIDVKAIGEQLDLHPSMVENLVTLQQEQGDRGDLAVGAIIMIADEQQRQHQGYDANTSFSRAWTRRHEVDERISRLSRKIVKDQMPLREIIAETVMKFVNKVINADVEKQIEVCRIRVRVAGWKANTSHKTMDMLAEFQLQQFRTFLKEATGTFPGTLPTVNTIKTLDSAVIEEAGRSADAAIADVFYTASLIIQRDQENPPEDREPATIDKAFEEAMDLHVTEAEEMSRRRRETYQGLPPPQVIDRAIRAIEQIKRLLGQQPLEIGDITEELPLTCGLAQDVTMRLRDLQQKEGQSVLAKQASDKDVAGIFYAAMVLMQNRPGSYGDRGTEGINDALRKALEEGVSRAIGRLPREQTAQEIVNAAVEEMKRIAGQGQQPVIDR